MFCQRVLDWLRVRDYAVEKQKSAVKVAARYSRGNVALQNGWFLTRSGLEKLSADGDTAMKQMQKKAPIR
jgi:hypothetical protein